MIVFNIKLNNMKSQDIRNKWIKFFESKDHLFIPSESLIPHNDPSLLWINSGVATLKDYFSGKKKPPSKRLVNSQKSIRTNDIENVGVTARHHTFFEMLGNFSIGDYFKNEAIEFANEFLIDVLKLDKKYIYITYFEEDIEVKEKWISLGYSEKHLISGNRDLNFWDVGAGPCGPNTEIFYDRGEKYNSIGPRLIKEDIENDRFIEIWNIVFSEYNNLGNNEYVELAQKNIDTGAGFERIVSIMQNVPTNFDTDLFQKIIKEVEKYSKFKYDIENYFIKDLEQEKINKHFKIISDHMRAIVNAINDGAKPSNTQRGYIIRRLIRRAYYSGIKLGIKEKTFLKNFVQITKETLIFDIDVKNVSNIIEKEEENFSKTILNGEKILEKELEKKSSLFDVNVAFKLFETFGFPIEMTNDILLENNVKLDFEKLKKLKNNHSQISKGQEKHSSFSKTINSLALVDGFISKFVGYEEIESESKPVFLINEFEKIKKINGEAYLILDKTPFYATSGGQLHDKGYLLQSGNRIEVLDVFKDKNNNHVHKVKGLINDSDIIQSFVDSHNRIGLMRNHSSTHLLFATLREIYGDKIVQLGSDITAERFTFDFPLDKKPTEAELKIIENKINKIIERNIEREYIVTTISEAKKIGATMTVEETKYLNNSDVRIVKFGNITTDLCGGTHIDQTKNIEKIKIVSIETKGAGIYRIRVITSNDLIEKYMRIEIKKHKSLLQPLVKKMNELSSTSKKYLFKNENNLGEYLEDIKNKIVKYKNEIKELTKSSNKISLPIDLEERNINGIKLFFSDVVDKSMIKNIAIKTREKYPDAIIVLLSKFSDNSLVVITSKNNKIQNLINNLIETYKIKGGGNANMWQGMSSNKIDVNDIEKNL